MNRIATTAAFLGLLLLLSACSMREVKQNYDDTRNWVLNTEPTAKPSHVEDTTPLIDLNYEAADALDSDLWLKFAPSSPIYYQAFTNQADPTDTAPFGTVVADQVAARLAQLDHNVVSGDPRSDDYTTPRISRTTATVPAATPQPGSKATSETSTDLPPDTETPKATSATEENTSPAPVSAKTDLPIDEQFRPILPSVMTGTYLLGDDVIFVSAKITTLRDNQLISGYQWTLPINQNTRMLLPQMLSPQRGMTPTVQTRF
ncbi:MAG: hypothetical protein KKB70_04735 [Proteobacteria bacterium]|nr:hypothetical protein [Pseudomonadota bacterium]MBU1611902.1 hypothetical protein [Pseudomonadota bacterium]